MKKSIVIILISTTLLCVNINSLHANNEDNGDTLDLNTEDIKNKKEDFSSLTDINGVNLFTDDFTSSLKKKIKAEADGFSEVEESLFTKKIVNNNSKKSDANRNLFNAPVAFEKTSIQEYTDESTAPLFVVGTILLCIIAYILTRKSYKKKKEGTYEDNSNAYEYN